MSQTNTMNINDAPIGAMGQKYLVAGDAMALRSWHDEPPGEGGAEHQRDYETVGYVVAGKVELTVDGNATTLVAGDSWHVPKAAKHSYRVIESLTAIEATHPPARDEGDAPAG